jgi:hypothetical protein
MPVSCLLSPQQRRESEHSGTSHLCQQETNGTAANRLRSIGEYTAVSSPAVVVGYRVLARNRRSPPPAPSFLRR